MPTARALLPAALAALLCLALAGCGSPRASSADGFTLLPGGRDAVEREPWSPLPCDPSGVTEAGATVRPAGRFTDLNQSASALATWLGMGVAAAEPGDGGAWTWRLEDGFLQVRGEGGGLHGVANGTDALGPDAASARRSLLDAVDLLALPDELRLDVVVDDGADGFASARVRQSVDGVPLQDVLWVQVAGVGERAVTTIEARGAVDVPGRVGLLDPAPLGAQVAAVATCEHGPPRSDLAMGDPHLEANPRLAWTFTEQTSQPCGWESRTVRFDALTGAVLGTDAAFATC